MHNVLTHFFTLDSSKMEVLETYFFDMVTTKNDHPRYVKHVLSPIYVFFTLFGYWARRGGGVLQGIGTQPAYAICTLDNSKIEVTSQRLLDLV